MNRSYASRLAIAAVIAFASTGAFAADYTKEHLAAARAAIQASRFADGFDNILLEVVKATKTNFIKNNPSFSTPIEEVTTQVAIELAARRADLDKEFQQIWASKFTKPELEEITKFYSSPTGIKLNTETRNILPMTAQVVNGWREKLATDMITRVREELKKRGIVI